MPNRPDKQPDLEDLDLLAQYATAYDRIKGPRVGDFIEFADGVTRRVSHIWSPLENRCAELQTSDTGSWHMGRGWSNSEAYVSFSGSLFHITPEDKCTLTGQQRLGWVWIWHHGQSGADRGVFCQTQFRVFSSTEKAPR